MPTLAAAFLRLLALLSLVVMPVVASAQSCDGALPPPGPDGRVAGHFPYGDAPPEDIVPAPAGFGLKPYCRLHRAMIPDLQRLLDAARRDPSVGGVLHGLSCHREVARQRNVFCRDRNVLAAERAFSVAPAGHSEHATGYAIDFAVRPAHGCPDAEACMAATPAARWLFANAPRFGFEMSFPAGNKQRVKWEPWHWRWVGTSPTAPGAAQARAVFAKARAQFPADPGVRDPLKVMVTSQPPVPVVAVAPVTVKKKGKRR
ncbi:D-alanyl-D-alanine carboxypeptidase family protein [Sphingomonas sp. S17]|jgi:D-alanyl-D-alanine carboxypeptidase|uniref:M15 family metallopeptidase n=2 Tax=Sphingomonas paucimobilis TaxID=13689 RepID=A0A411LI46_SPHPI|nr:MULTISPECIES: M15 family metallopeptidase [Pseudomonadota]EGI54967.1 D-alanyl-D-alanine carboxypeptidase family protein [Sphingomonas sp. S17]MBQ1479499.1 M15 family metallopeptidase [Sphingomonas sp.]MCM3678069.1 M15 family metallopeptidase [Sphingomonas paucimobilis]MDG5972702.1 M15 family metallopeptidase [Sphingomonas paucimobilis]NNG59236.1 M15 family metallopeptidase [Sphingomonas paucimobilis]